MVARKRPRLGFVLTILGLAVAAGLVFTLARWREPQPLRIRADLGDRGIGLRAVTVYYLEPGSAVLVPRRREVLAEETAGDLARQIVSRLSSLDEDGVDPPLPPGTQLLHYFEIGNGEAVLDFNERIESLGGASLHEERLRLTALFRSITENLEGIRSLRLLVHGRPVEGWGSHLSAHHLTASG